MFYSKGRPRFLDVSRCRLIGGFAIQNFYIFSIFYHKRFKPSLKTGMEKIATSHSFHLANYSHPAVSVAFQGKVYVVGGSADGRTLNTFEVGRCRWAAALNKASNIGDI